MSQPTVVVTGAAGKLGRATVNALVAAGMTVRATDRQPAHPALPVPITIGNLLNREETYRLLEGSNVLIHLGNHPNESAGDAQTVFSENVTMNIHAFQAAQDLGYHKIVFASSVQVFAGDYHRGHPPGFTIAYLPADGDFPPRPGNTYALSKQTGEVMLQYFADRGLQEAVAVRFPFLGSPEQLNLLRDPNRRHLPGRPNELFAFLTLTDAASLLEKIVATPLPGFRTYFPAARENIRGMPTQALVDSEYPGVPLRIPDGTALESLVDLSRLRAETGWEPIC